MLIFICAVKTFNNMGGDNVERGGGESYGWEDDGEDNKE